MSAIESWGLVAGVGVLAAVAFLLLRDAVLYYWAREDLATPRGSAVRGVRKKGPDEVPPDGPPLQPYERLADVWGAYAGVTAPAYAGFLPRLARRYRLRVDSVLDLACGAGTLTAQLAERFPAVVGLDVSPHMLEQARRRCSARDNVRLVQGDFRTFELPEQFDVAVCGWDSLNYLEHPADLRLVLQRVWRHLRPGGLFVCDAMVALFYSGASQLTVCLGAGGVAFDFVHSYDPATRSVETRVVFNSGVERHRRIPLEPADIRAAAADSGFELLDAFSRDGYRFFYVLRKISRPAGEADGRP
jgi:SAM-dependent methyltransferase